MGGAVKVHVATGRMDGERAVIGVSSDLAKLEAYATSKQDVFGCLYEDIEYTLDVEFVDPPAQVVVAHTIGTLNM